MYSPNDSSSDGRHVKTNKQIHPDESDIRPNENGVKNSYRPGDVSHPVDSSPEASTDTILEHDPNNECFQCENDCADCQGDQHFSNLADSLDDCTENDD